MTMFARHDCGSTQTLYRAQFRTQNRCTLLLELL